MTDDARRDLHQANRLSWNEATAAHNSHKGDQAAFFRDGGHTLFPEEIDLLGDLKGRRLVHLQCNSGQDSLSIARLGAEVTGVDISDEAVRFATQLSADSAIPARFERADVYDWLEEQPDAGFDIVFCSYGALCWLSDLAGWAAQIRRILTPGGRLVVLEFHPATGVFEEVDDPEDPLRLRYPGMSAEPITWKDGIDDYVARSDEGLTPMGYEEGVENFENPNPCHEFTWGLGEVLGAVAAAGLIIRRVEEYPFSNGCRFFKSQIERPGRRFTLPEGKPRLPHMFGFVAERS